MIYLSLPALGRIESRAVLAILMVFQCLPIEYLTNIRKYENLNSMLAASFSLSPPFLPPFPPFSLPSYPTKYIAKPKF